MPTLRDRQRAADAGPNAQRAHGQGHDAGRRRASTADEAQEYDHKRRVAVASFPPELNSPNPNEYLDAAFCRASFAESPFQKPCYVIDLQEK